MAKRRPKAELIQFPPGGREGKAINVRQLLLDNQSTPRVARPSALDAAIERRARELAKEAYALCEEHLQRRVAYQCEGGYPERVLDVAKAHAVINEGDLGDALTRVFSHKLTHLAWAASSVARSSAEFSAEIEELLQQFEGA
jgi:hypothetical protein